MKISGSVKVFPNRVRVFKPVDTVVIKTLLNVLFYVRLLFILEIGDSKNRVTEVTLTTVRLFY